MASKPRTFTRYEVRVGRKKYMAASPSGHWISGQPSIKENIQELK